MASENPHDYLLMPTPTPVSTLVKRVLFPASLIPHISVDGWPLYMLLLLCGTCFPFRILQPPVCLTYRIIFQAPLSLELCCPIQEPLATCG